MKRYLFALACLLLPTTAFAQFPPPTGPVTVCFTQAAPEASSWEMVFDGAAPEAIAPVAPVAVCAANSTHSFEVPAARFTLGQHTMQIRSINQFGATLGPIRNVEVGLAPGEATITGVHPPPVVEI